MRCCAALIFTAFLGACSTMNGAGELPAPSQPPAQRTAWAVNAEGRAMGQATFTQAHGGVLIHLEFSERALPPGWHGAHLHQIGDCSDFAAGFRASGAHLGSGERVSHGLMHANGPEAGDLPNLFAPPAGVFGAEFFTRHVQLGGERTPGNANTREVLPLLDADSTALVIHAAPDDQSSQPVGGAGARIACVALTATP
jgi:Cu-Zn family superoxide dismutase